MTTWDCPTFTLTIYILKLLFQSFLTYWLASVISFICKRAFEIKRVLNSLYFQFSHNLVVLKYKTQEDWMLVKSKSNDKLALKTCILFYESAFWKLFQMIYLYLVHIILVYSLIYFDQNRELNAKTNCMQFNTLLDYFFLFY